MSSCQILPVLTLFLLISSQAIAQNSRQAPANPFLGSVSKGTVMPATRRSVSVGLETLSPRH
jgi:hypothetical protein